MGQPLQYPHLPKVRHAHFPAHQFWQQCISQCREGADLGLVGIYFFILLVSSAPF